MLKQGNTKPSILKVLGVLVTLLSLYYMCKSGYHVLFYDTTGGRDFITSHITRSFAEVVMELLFWIITFLGGVGISTDSRKGLLLGLMAAGVAVLPSLVCLLVSIHKVSTYSKKLVIYSGESFNGVEREMTKSEKLDFIYQDLFYSLSIALLVLALVLLVIKRRKSLKVTNQPIFHNKSHRA